MVSTIYQTLIYCLTINIKESTGLLCQGNTTCAFVASRRGVAISFDTDGTSSDCSMCLVAQWPSFCIRWWPCQLRSDEVHLAADIPLRRPGYFLRLWDCARWWSRHGGCSGSTWDSPWPHLFPQPVHRSILSSTKGRWKVGQSFTAHIVHLSFWSGTRENQRVLLQTLPNITFCSPHSKQQQNMTDEVICSTRWRTSSKSF